MFHQIFLQNVVFRINEGHGGHWYQSLVSVHSVPWRCVYNLQKNHLVKQ